MLSLLSYASVLLLPLAVHGQTFTACNPLNETNCPIMPALGTNATFDWKTSQADSSIWKSTSGAAKYTDHGADFIIGGQGDSPTIQSTFYIFFGRVSVLLRAAAGNAVVSSVVLQSDDLDEVDWEWLGQNTTHVQSNYFGKGDTTTYDRAIWHTVNDTHTVHNYTTHWTKEKLEWYIDDNLIRTLTFDDAKGGTRYPQTPMNIRIGIWSGGDATRNSKGTMEWAGGVTDFKKAPFTMTVPQVYAEDYTSGKTYKYGDKTGSWQSIVVEEGTSSAAAEIYSPHGVSGRWNALPKAAQVGIVAGSLSVVAVLFAILMFCCIKQRRAGRVERSKLDAEFARGQAELLDYKQKAKTEFTTSSRPRYTPKLNGGRF